MMKTNTSLSSFHPFNRIVWLLALPSGTYNLNCYNAIKACKYRLFVVAEKMPNREGTCVAVLKRKKKKIQCVFPFTKSSLKCSIIFTFNPLSSPFCFLVSAVLSILGNLLVLIMAFKRSSKMKPPELLSVNLAVTDLGAAVTMYPLAVASAWNHHWIGGDVACIYYGLAGFFFGLASIMNLTILAIVRFIVSLNLNSPSEYYRCLKH